VTSVPRLVGLTDGDPWASSTWSGSSVGLFRALDARKALIGAVSSKPGVLASLDKAASWSRDGTRWHQRYWSSSSPLGPLVRAAMTGVGSWRAGRLARAPDALLQISGWYRGDRLGCRPRLLCTYQDSNSVLWRSRPDLAIAPDDRRLARVTRHERAVYDRMDVIFTMSEWARSSFIGDFGQDPQKVVVVGAGANLATVPDVPERDWHIPRVLFVGRSFERKGGPHLLAAFEELRRRQPRARLTIVGPPRRDPVPPGVDWVGPVARSAAGGPELIDRLYREATVLALPTRFEGFGMPYLEAMAYGLPCVATATCAIPEIVEHGVTGLLVPPADGRAIVEALCALADDPAEAAAMGRRGRGRWERRFTWGQVADAILRTIADRLP
jgi:glycosyltransferase involved in cell wall biosynthesis